MSSPNWRFDTDTSNIANRPLGNSSPWRLTGNTTNAFRLLAEQSCNILSGCQARCEKARLSGTQKALVDVAMWIEESTGGAGRATPPTTEFILMDTLIAHFGRLLRMQEKPAGVDRMSMASSSSSSSSSSSGASSADASTCVEKIDGLSYEGGWEAVDSAFTDDMFRAGCILFTKFYKERTKEIRLAFVCGYRDALEHLVRSCSQIQVGRRVRAAEVLALCEDPYSFPQQEAEASVEAHYNHQQQTHHHRTQSQHPHSMGNPTNSSTSSTVRPTEEEEEEEDEQQHVVMMDADVPTSSSAGSSSEQDKQQQVVPPLFPSWQGGHTASNPLQHWYPPGSKREFVVDPDSDDEEETLYTQFKRTRFA